jgi:uncharacterized protein
MSASEAAESGLWSAPKNLLLLLLRGYKRALSPMSLPSCRYVPTCSDYAAEAIDKFGAVRGTGLALWRLLRCHPFVRGGFDPVPGHICSHTTH